MIQGIWNDATDITIDFVQPVLKNQMSFDIDMIKFATSLLNKSEVYKTIFNHYKEWLTENFSYRVSPWFDIVPLPRASFLCSSLSLAVLADRNGRGGR